jgi:hypothetical protein
MESITSKLTPDNTKPSIYVSDYTTIARTWRERLFTLPFRPFQKTKTIGRPTAFEVDGVYFVSLKSYEKLQKIWREPK